MRVLFKLVGQELNFVDDLVGVAAVALASQVTALLVQLVPLAGSLILHNEALLPQAPANVSVDVLEPAAQLGILVRITVNVVQRLEKVSQRSVVGKAFNESAEVVLDSFDAVSRPNISDGAATLLADGLSVTSVLLSQVKKSLDSLLVCMKE